MVKKNNQSTSTVVFETLKSDDSSYVMHTYGRLPVCFVKGQGLKLWDEKGKEYLDFLSGIGVNGLGHCHPAIVEAITKQAATLIETSNLYYTEPQVRLAKKLAEISGFDKVFFCNSGTEANEAALKIARKAGKKTSPDKSGIIALNGAFHGRTFGSLSATAQGKYQDPFRPLLPGFTYVDPEDTTGLQLAVNKNTCAIIMEVIQGEGGIHPLSTEFLQLARSLADEFRAILIFDEVQCGFGRTGHWWAFEGAGVKPDVFTSAKALGGGFPIGACIARGDAADVFTPGDHASTYGGNPLGASASLAAIETIENEHLLDNAKEMGEYLRKKLQDVLGSCIKEIRGQGLMVGIELSKPIARGVLMSALEEGLIINAIGDSVIRMLPPFIVSKDDIDKAISILSEVII
jgi:predicted acetylornithine/succinylornithine family transaminase